MGPLRGLETGLEVNAPRELERRRDLPKDVEEEHRWRIPVRC